MGHMSNFARPIRGHRTSSSLGEGPQKMESMAFSDEDNQDGSNGQQALSKGLTWVVL